MIPIPGLPNPFGAVGDLARGVVADGWTGIMLSLWGAGMWVLKFALSFMDRFMTPDITENGPAAEVYRTTFWIAGTLVVFMGLAQLGIAAGKRSGESFARVLIGTGQFVVVCAGWIAYGGAVLAACSGITHALLEGLLSINSWEHWDPMAGYDFGETEIEGILATVLGFLGILLWIAAIGHFVVMLARGAALLVLAAVTPIAAAGLVSETGRSWFWKSFRWFHAAALTPVLTTLVTGIGMKLAGATAQGGADSAEKALGTAIPAVVLVLISLVAPVGLFRLLAFVDPGTSSGASMRAGLAAAGGLGGLLSGTKGSGSTTSDAASTSNSGGRSDGEAQSNAATASRFSSALGALGTGISMVTKAGTMASTVGFDEMNQMAVGDSSYYPDYSDRGQRFNPDQRAPETDGIDGGDAAPPSMPSPGVTPSAGKPPAPAGAGGQGGGVSAAAAEVPPVV